MIEPISFFVAGEAKGQPRPRAFARKFGNKWQARVYDAKTAEGWKGLVAAAWKEHAPENFVRLDGPVALRLVFYMPRPKAHFLKSGLRPAAPLFHLGKPDGDNLAKAVMDALTQLGVWGDDSQVCDLWVVKCYPPATSVGAQITVSEARAE